jgi:hypothetical protein
MKRLNFLFLVCAMLFTVLYNCDETESECGDEKTGIQEASQGFFFNNPADIYWGVTSGVRSYTYNYEFGNICTKQYPQVWFGLYLLNSNSGSANPISVSAGVYTCLGVQAYHITMAPEAGQDSYQSPITEIGLKQCFNGKSSATIYPYMTVSFNTLGSNHEDSLFLCKNVVIMAAHIEYNVPK